jgi:hypothetical protein
MRSVLLGTWLLLAACGLRPPPPDAPSDSGVDSGADSGVDSGADTAGEDCGEAGICALVVTDVVLGTTDPATPRRLSAAPAGPGRITVEDDHFADGCCPTPTVTAEASLRRSTIEPAYGLSDDLCDCVAALTLRYTVSGIPAGTYELRQGGASTSVIVE